MLSHTIEEILAEHGRQYLDDDTTWVQMQDWLRTTLTQVAEEARREGAEDMRKKAVETVKGFPVHLTDARFNPDDEPKIIHTVDVEPVIEQLALLSPRE